MGRAIFFLERPYIEISNKYIKAIVGIVIAIYKSKQSVKLIYLYGILPHEKHE